jgi:hypothetical protein
MCVSVFFRWFIVHLLSVFWIFLSLALPSAWNNLFFSLLPLHTVSSLSFLYKACCVVVTQLLRDLFLVAWFCYSVLFLWSFYLGIDLEFSLAFLLICWFIYLPFPDWIISSMRPNTILFPSPGLWPRGQAQYCNIFWKLLCEHWYLTNQNW